MPKSAETPRMTPAIANAIVRALRSGIPKLVIFRGTNAENTLAWKARGDMIEDPECVDHVVEALANGVYFRCPEVRSGLPTSFNWIFLCPSDDLHEIIGNRAQEFTEAEVLAAGVDAAFQAQQWEETRKREPNREASPSALEIEAMAEKLAHSAAGSN